MRGSKPGERRGGRQKGTPNKRRKAVEEALEEAAIIIGESIPNRFQGDAHALLLAVYSDPRVKLSTRIDAAKAAAPYEKPRLATVENKTDLSVSDPLKEMFERIAQAGKKVYE